MVQNIIIFGVGGGIGKSILRDAHKWATNIITASRSDISKIWDESWGEFPPNVTHISTDLTEHKNIIDVFSSAKEKFGRIHIVINTIGGSLFTHPIESFPIEEFDRVINVNLRTAFIITQESIKNMKNNQEGGNLVHIVSSSAKVQSTNKAPYGMAKAAQARLIQYAAGESAQYDIRINGITPTYVFTERHLEDIQKKIDSGKDKESIENHIFRRQLIKKPLYPEDIIPVIQLLAKTKVITGQIYNVTLGEVISY